jgi:hypothetical protein
MAKKKKMARTSLRPIVNEINKARRQLIARERDATGLEARQLRIDVKKLERCSVSLQFICRGFFV